MTARQLYEGVLIELNKENAPNILLEDFNYFANKAINNYINKRYNIYDVNQQTTDDLRVLKATALLSPSQVTDYQGLTMAGDKHMATYEVVMPSDYLHILNCICIYKVKKTYKCYNAGDTWRAAATRLTADMYSQVLDNFWNKPTYKKPYYYIHNVNTSNFVPTNPYGGKEFLQLEIVRNWDWYNDSEMLSSSSNESLTTDPGDGADLENTLNGNFYVDSQTLYPRILYFGNIPNLYYLTVDENQVLAVDNDSKVIKITPDELLNGAHYTVTEDNDNYIIDDGNGSSFTFPKTATINDDNNTSSSGFRMLKLGVDCSNTSYNASSNYGGTTESAHFKYELGNSNYGLDAFGHDIVQGIGLPRTIDITNDGEIKPVSNIERGLGLRYGNVSLVRLEIRYGTDNQVFELKQVYVDYIKAPQNIRLTQLEIDLTEDTSQMLEYPDYVCQEIINELVHLVMENISDLRLQTHPVVTLSIANPAQALAPQAQGLSAQ